MHTYQVSHSNPSIHGPVRIMDEIICFFCSRVPLLSSSSLVRLNLASQQLPQQLLGIQRRRRRQVVALADRAGRATADSGAGVGGAVRGHVLLLLSREYFALLRPLLESGVPSPSGTTSVQQSKRGVREWDRSLVSLSGGSPASSLQSSPSRLPCRLRSGVSVSVPFQGLHCCVALHDSRVKKMFGGPPP